MLSLLIFVLLVKKIGIAEPLLPYLYESRWLNTMVIGPPQTGKTTLLRDVARCMSQGVSTSKIPSCKVGIVDERSEIAGCVKGIPQYDFGTTSRCVRCMSKS